VTRRRDAIVREVRQSGGAVLVLVALILPVMIGFGGLVVDVGNWFSHRRHLQVEADAGALAGAGAFRAPCVPTDIVRAATNYSSVTFLGSGLTPGPSYNPQVQNTAAANLKGKINSQTYYPNRAAPLDTTVPAGDPDPCVARMIDVKLTETDLPWFLKFAGVDYIDAHARIEIKKKTTATGSLPVGVPEIGPKNVKAQFIDEATGNVIATTPLTPAGTQGGLSIWSNSAAPVPVTVNYADIGVRIILSGAASTQCGDPLVDCYGAGTSTAIVSGAPGLVHVRGYTSPPGGTAAAPKAGSVDLLGGTCEDGYFTATAAANPCTVNVSALVDFGAAPVSTSRVSALRTGANANTAVDLTPPAVAGGAWTGGGITVNRGEGAVGITLRWEAGCDTDRSKNCGGTSGTLGTVQRTFAGSEDPVVTGPIKLLQLFNGGVSGADTFARCATCTHNLVVKLGLKPGLQLAQSINDPIVSLKLAGGGSQNQSLDCDPAISNLRDELAQGCGPSYDVNTGQTCPSTANALWNSPANWTCVAVSTGATVGQVTQGINQRVLGSTNANVCTAQNHWSSYGTAAGLPAGDPRIIEVFLTPFAAFSGTGQATVPVIGFATFYITGWDGGACQGQGDDPAGQGAIVGHYVKTIDTLHSGTSTEFCDFDALGSCFAQFTR
jgi:hypothetical protein